MFIQPGAEDYIRAFALVSAQCCVVLSLVAGHARADDVMTTIEALEAGMAQWRESVNFYGTFLTRRGAESEVTFEDALAGRFGAAIGAAEDRGKGVVVKLGRFLRTSVTWDRPPHYNRRNSSGVIVSRVSAECVGCPEFFFDYRTNPEFAGEIRVYRRTKQDLGVLRACGIGPLVVDPFSFHGGDAHRPISGLFEGDGAKLMKAEARVEGAHIVLRLELERARRSMRTLWFSRDYSPPLLIRQETVTYNADGSIAVRSEMRAENIVPVQGGSMASVVRFAMGPVRDTRGEMTYVCEVWVSEDLGRRPPSEDDLAVEIGPEIEIIGLRNAPPPGKRRRFALNQYTVEDLQEPEEGPVAVPRRAPPALPAPPSKLPRPIMVILGAVCVAAVGALIWRARRRRKAG